MTAAQTPKQGSGLRWTDCGVPRTQHARGPSLMHGSMLSVITAVFFDGDQTLWDFEKLMRRAMVATLGELKTLRPGQATEQLDVDSLVADREAVTPEDAATDEEGGADERGDHPGAVLGQGEHAQPRRHEHAYGDRRVRAAGSTTEIHPARPYTGCGNQASGVHGSVCETADSGADAEAGTAMLSRNAPGRSRPDAGSSG